MGEPTNNEWIPEQAIADALSVPREIIRKRRPHLGAGEVRQSINVIEWQKNAARRVAKELGLRWPDDPPAVPEKIAPTPTPAAANGEEELTVIMAALNPNIVNARRANGAQVAVRVMDNKKYVPMAHDGQPMKLTARPSGSGAWWVLVGREPRWRGKW